ncbi:MAG: SDR family NAD(P)-dependent oxidoreductase [Balneolaceae bacterium]|nr:SDR family NAD(P)-dependent oxidoreductase [Balneolaceae bacterium]
MNLDSKSAIVTGASSGIGRSFSRALVEKGATVYGLARSLDKLKRISDELGKAFIPVQMDVTSPEQLDQWVEETFDGQLLPDILVNNAGTASFGEVEELSLKDWDTMIETNISGIFYVTRLITPLMKKNGAVCHIVNISSIAGRIGNPQLTGYNASKFAVRGFSEALFKELRYDGIKVTCFYPGSIATSFFDRVDMETHSNMMQPDDVAKVLIDVLETPDNFLINEIVMRPLNPKPPEEA